LGEVVAAESLHMCLLKSLSSVFSVVSVVKNNLAYIGIGSNLNDPVHQCNLALRALTADPESRVAEVSPFYRTEPVGKKDQNWFVNAAAALETSRSPRGLLLFLQSLERAMGRERKEKWGPRTIDLDLLFYEDRVLREGDLVIPHPRLHERRFVLVPLNDIAPGWRHPVLEKTIAEILAELPGGEKVIPLRETDLKACGGFSSI
jgi:2-amino-4-hydroxy-6-hydroxymethyldihydropteridine diphosphokinase